MEVLVNVLDELVGLLWLGDVLELLELCVLKLLELDVLVQWMS